MPLSFEQFKELRSKGLTVDQISKFETGEKPTQQPKKSFQVPGVSQATRGFANLNIGLLKGVGSTLRGASSLGERGIKSVGRLVTPKRFEEKLGFVKEKTTSAERLIPEEVIKPRGASQKIGFGIEQVGEFFIPGSMSLKAGKVAGAITKGGKLAKGATKLGAIGATEAVLGTGQSALQRGKLGKEELGVGAISLVAPTALAGAGKIAKAIMPKPVKDVIRQAVDKAIRPSVKSFRKMGFYDKAEEAFDVMRQNKVVFEGEEVVRNPGNITEMIETMKESKINVYNAYDTISRRAGEAGAKFSPKSIMADLSNWIKKKGFSSEIKIYAKNRLRGLANLDGATPGQVQDRIEELNATFNPLSITMESKIDGSISRKLRESLDNLILKTGGQEYQGFRNQYSALKTIEDDLMKRGASEARKSQIGLSGYTDIFTGADLLGGLMTSNPALLARGVAGRGIKEFQKWLTNPNRLIQKAFDALEKSPLPISPFRTSRQPLLPKGKSLTKEIKTPIHLPKETLSTIEAREIQELMRQGKKKELLERLKGLTKEEIQKLLPEGTGITGAPIPTRAPASSFPIKEIDKTRR